jgi:hypothetical protein
MQSLSNTASAQQISSKIDAAKTYNDVSKSSEQQKKSFGDSASEAANKISTQLNKIRDQQKRFLREPPTSMDTLLNFLGQTKGNGGETLKYLKRKTLEVATKIEPKMVEILKEESVKALGCSQEQTYQGVSVDSLRLQPLPLRPQQEGIYIPVQSVDFFSNLKNSPESAVGQVYYEKPEPSGDNKFKPFGGNENFPMNKQLYQLMDSTNAGRALSQVIGKDYTGKSGKPIFDIQYTEQNSFGVTGNYYRVLLLDRIDQSQPSGTTLNKVGEMISDYYSTINLVDPVDIGVQLVNLLSGAIDTKAELGAGAIENQSKFFLIAQRILGLCFDNRREIDVSGISKIAELDGVDDSFFELTEVDLRNIDITINNVQNGIMEFIDCDNVKLPVNIDVLIDELIGFRDKLSGQTEEEKVSILETITNSLVSPPELNLFIPSNLNVQASIDKSVIKKLPLAVAAGVFTPKVLLPIYTLLSVVQSGATYTYNQQVTSANTFIQSGNTIGQQGSNIVTSGLDFIKIWKTFTIQVISRINAEFLKVLFEELKKDIVLLISLIVRDIQRSKRSKKIAMVLRLVGIFIAVGQLISDFRRCKSILDNILAILNLINGFGNGQNNIPFALMLASKFLPGTSPERSFINTIEILQSQGIPTGTLPDGSPNLMLLYNLATHRGADKENAENGKLEAYGVVPPVTGGLVTIFGKSF